MDFVDLRRSFFPILKDNEPNLELGRVWGRRVGGWLNWSDLLLQRRVVVLAEAFSGKTEEFRHQAQTLASEGKPAFLLRVEELADQGFEGALSTDEARTFEQWQSGSGEGYFFLDSVDEARLNRRNFETALKRFARDLGRATERARVYISCRVSDWSNAQDRASVERILPVFERPKPSNAGSGVDPLLDPLFNPKKDDKSERVAAEKKTDPLLVVQLVALEPDQCKTLAAAAGVSDGDAFMAGIQQHGLEAFTERPGDILDLAGYWKAHRKFDPLTKMVDHAVNLKLAESQPNRGDNGALSIDKALEGAERLAAALTLGKSFTLRAPGADPDPSLTSGALDPAALLPEWTEVERSALLRRGIFAPSTYDRVRFHHRSTQEYLAARWFERMMKANCPESEVRGIFFVDRYGVPTVPPTLRPAAAWIAHWRPEFREELIRRAPVSLVIYGDPASLPIESRRSLLRSWAQKDGSGDLGDEMIDNRALWMIADQALASVIKQVWESNPRNEFRFDLLRLVREGAISGCVNLAASAVADSTGSDHHRLVALQAIRACGDEPTLKALANRIVGRDGDFGPNLVASFAEELFPTHISVAELLAVIKTAPPESAYSTEGFGYRLAKLYHACPDAKARDKFVGGLADLCLTPPFQSNYQRVSAKHFSLSKELSVLAREEVVALANRAPTESQVRLLMALERGDRRFEGTDEPSLSELVRANKALNRALFWADIDEHRRNRLGTLTHYFQMHVSGGVLWQLDENDLEWLLEDFRKRTLEDKRIALTAIVTLLSRSGRLATEEEKLKAETASEPTLREDLEKLISPQPIDADLRHHEQQARRYATERKKQQQAEKDAWKAFATHVQAHPEHLRDPALLKAWNNGSVRLHNLSQWLRKRIGSDDNAPSQWRLLEEAFGRSAAEAYRDGMKLLWRLSKPERPTRTEGGPVTYRYPAILAFEAVGLEASDDADWAAGLTDDEAKLAAEHGCFAERGYPEWMDELVNARSDVVVPIVSAELEREWAASGPGSSDFLYHCANRANSIPADLEEALLAIVSGQEPAELKTLDLGLRILARLKLNDQQKSDLRTICKSNLEKHTSTKDVDWALRSLAMKMIIHVDDAASGLEEWFDGSLSSDKSFAERTFATLFDPHDPLVAGALQHAVARTLERLLTLAYRVVRPSDDLHHTKVYTPGVRDNAQSARSVILKWLVERSGEDAYRAMQRLSSAPEFAERAVRFRELTRAKADQDAEPPPWEEQDIVRFAKTNLAPAKTGADLLRLVLGVFSDIQVHLDTADVTSRALLQRADDEEEVKQWLVEQVNYRARQRFHAYREVEVSDRKKPDVAVASTSVQSELAIEVKHGGKRWTAADFESALRVQLAETYLRPETRRHGVLVISNHRQRRWMSKDGKKRLGFEELIAWLQSIATTIIENDAGAIEVHCVGIDAVPKKK